MDWQTPVLTALMTTVSSSVVVGLLQIYWNHRLSMNLEQWKTTLSSQLFEHQTKFAWLHTERAKAIVRLYRLLATADKAFTDMLRPIQTGDHKEKMVAAGKGATRFFDFCDRNRVFFDEELSKKLVDLEIEYRKVWSTFVPNAESSAKGLVWLEAWEKLGKDVAPLRVQVQQKVREMLEVENAEQK